MKLKMKKVAICVFAALTLCVQAGPLEQSVATKQKILVSSIKISPAGNYLAVKTQRFGKATLTMLDRRTLNVLGSLAIAGDREVGEFYWANNDRIVSEIRYLSGGRKSTYQGELFAINFDGTQRALIQGKNTRLRIVDPLPENDGHVLVSVKPLLSEAGERGIATLLNIYQSIEQGQFDLLPDTLVEFYTSDLGEIQIASISEAETLRLSDNR